ncbi:MAG: ribbon-helix-helix domain-containing protein [Dehalococcoidia bacterium]|nr:ribbon-helix-helix domain-containing protein [Dehalococcoidia bacterium]
MAKVAKVAISLPQDILKIVEQERKTKGESRSEFFRRAVEELLRQEREKVAVEKYIQSYQQIPETTEEVEEALSIAGAVLAEEPWE